MTDPKKKRYTEAQAKSAKKYLSGLAEIKIRLTPQEKDDVLRYAAEEGKSVNQFIKDLIFGEIPEEFR